MTNRNTYEFNKREVDRIMREQKHLPFEKLLVFIYIEGIKQGLSYAEDIDNEIRFRDMDKEIPEDIKTELNNLYDQEKT